MLPLFIHPAGNGDPIFLPQLNIQEKQVQRCPPLYSRSSLPWEKHRISASFPAFSNQFSSSRFARRRQVLSSSHIPITIFSLPYNPFPFLQPRTFVSRQPHASANSLFAYFHYRKRRIQNQLFVRATLMNAPAGLASLNTCRLFGGVFLS